MTDPVGLLDTSTLLLLPRITDPATLPEIPLISAITLAELSALGPGSIVPLRITPGDPVFLRAGDRRIARAELVVLEGEVAARVLDLGV